VKPAVELVLVILLPTALGYAIIGGFRGGRWWLDRLHTRRYQAAPPAEPMERLSANLRRLRTQLDATETEGGVPAKAVRVTALRGAYVDALVTACSRLDVPPPAGGGRPPLAEIYRVEAALRERGLDVREPAAR
jgi:hypothetical protein